MAITPATARDLACKSHAQRRINAELRSFLPANADLLDRYVLAELLRERAHIARLHERIEQTTDAQEHERLARALNVHSERERNLAGRPAAGQRRPANEPVKRMPARAWAEPV